MSIFISIAAYRDLEVRTTIESAISNSSGENDIYFGVFSQADNHEFIDVSDIKNVKQRGVPASEAKGAGYARHMAEQFYDSQDYFLQIDAHCIFVKDWDTNLINWYKRIQSETNNDKIIISSWALPYRYEDKKIVLNSTKTHGWHWDGKMVPHYNTIIPYNNVWTAERIPMEDDYHESLCVLGGLIFATGNLIKEVPYDKRISWNGEEIVYSVRAYTRGWRIYSVKDNFLYHHYDRDLKRIWEDKPKDWSSLNHESIKTSLAVLSMKEKGVFGIADPLQYNEYQKKAGINMKREAGAKWRRL